MSIPTTEQGRINRIVQNTLNCAKAGAIARAKALYGRSPCATGLCTKQFPGAAQTTIPPESTYQSSRVGCYGYKGPEPCVPESVRIARLLQRSIDESTNPFNPIARFSEYRGPFIPPVCPPIPQEALNANVPKNLLMTCPLPNKPFNPSLP
jgi:hypothetical protein